MSLEDSQSLQPLLRGHLRPLFGLCCKRTLACTLSPWRFTSFSAMAWAPSARSSVRPLRVRFCSWWEVRHGGLLLDHLLLEGDDLRLLLGPRLLALAVGLGLLELLL